MSWCKSVPCQIWSPDFGHLELQNKMILKRTDLLRETGQHVKFFVKFATKVPYLTFCDNVWYRKWIERGEIKRKWGNVKSEYLSISSFSLHFLISSPFPLHFLTLSPFPLHFLILSPFSRIPDARMQQVVQPWLMILWFIMMIFMLGSLEANKTDRIWLNRHSRKMINLDFNKWLK